MLDILFSLSYFYYNSRKLPSTFIFLISFEEYGTPLIKLEHKIKLNDIKSYKASLSLIPSKNSDICELEGDINQNESSSTNNKNNLRQYGFIAHEVAECIPYITNGEKFSL